MLTWNWKVDVVATPLEAGVRINLGDEDGNTSLIMRASQNGHMEVVRFLVEARAGVDRRDRLRGGHVEIVRLLAQACANMQLVNTFGNAAFACARDIEIQQMLSEQTRPEASKTPIPFPEPRSPQLNVLNPKQTSRP